MPWTSSAMLVYGLSLIGLPLTAGFISKSIWSCGVDAGLGFVTALIRCRCVIYLLWKIVEVMDAPYKALDTENIMIYGPLWIVAAANIVFGIYAKPVVDLADAAARAITANALLGSVIGGGL